MLGQYQPQCKVIQQCYEEQKCNKIVVNGYFSKSKVLLLYFLKNNALKFLLFANYFVTLRRKQIKQNLT